MPKAVQNILSSRLLSTRGGTIAVGIFAALLALLVLLLYLSHYRSSIKNSSAPVPVLVAKHLIPQGTAGDVLGTNGGFEAAEVPKNDVKVGAVADIYPGQQLTETDFTLTATATLGSRLTGTQRAISIPVDATHGMIGQVVVGDRVDVFVNVGGVVRAVVQNVYVLSTSGAATGGIGSTSSGSSMTLRLSPSQAAKITLAADEDKMWIVLRPATRGGNIGPSIATTQQLLLGKTVPEGH